MCGGSGPLDDLGNILGRTFDDVGTMIKHPVEDTEELFTHRREKEKAEKKVKANEERLEGLRAKRKIADDTNVAKRKQVAARSQKRSKQKSKQDTGRKGTILTDELGESAGDISGTVGGKNLLGL